MSRSVAISDVDSFHSVSRVIFELIGNGSRVLDVGCSTGRLGEKLRLEKSCYVAGIELDQKRSEVAKKRLDEVFTGDVELMTDLPFRTESFDTVVFADTLEHFRLPARVLAKVAHYLKRDGQGIFSIPNVANWSVRARLLSGKWDYKERGLLDSTHVRFFTLKTSRRLLAQCGFTVERTQCLSGWSWLDSRMPNKNPANFWKGLLGCNFIMTASKVSGRDHKT